MIITFLHDEPEIYPTPAGGKERCIMNLAYELAKKQQITRINIITRSASLSKESINLGRKIKLFKYNGYELPRKILEFCERSDILSVHLCSFQLPYLLSHKCKFIYHLHDIIYATTDRGSHLDKSLAIPYSAIYSPSKFATDFYKNLFWWTNQKKSIVTIPRGINIKEINDAIKNPEEYIKTLPLDIRKALRSTDFKLFFPHRLNSFKGEHFLEKIIKLLIQNSIKFKIFIPDKHEDRSLVLKSTNVIILPWSTGKQLYSIYSKMDLTLNLSLNPETFSQTVIDSIAANTPVVCFPFGNLKTLANELPAVFTVEPKITSIVREILLILKNKESVLKKVVISKNRLIKKYSIETIARLYLSSFKKLNSPVVTHVPSVSKTPKKYLQSPYICQFGDICYLSKGESINRITLTRNQLYIVKLAYKSITLKQIKKKAVLKSTKKDVKYLIDQGILIEV